MAVKCRFQTQLIRPLTPTSLCNAVDGLKIRLQMVTRQSLVMASDKKTIMMSQDIFEKICDVVGQLKG